MARHIGLPGDADLFYQLRSLPVAGTVLHVGAHPDDEDSGLIAFLSRGLGLRTVYWSATRGEGGQNRLGPERGEALGIIRTWESLEARTLDGGEVLYGPFFDFGFSKTGQGTLAKWGRDDLLTEIVRAIRAIRPQVVVSRWSGTPADGHGHHEAVGLVMEEAFDAAGDPGRYGELRGVGLVPWSASKLYRSIGGDWQPGEDVVRGRRQADLDRDGVLRIDGGAFDPVSGLTFQQIASLGRNCHRSQAMAELPERGSHFSYYALSRSLVPAEGAETSFFDGLDVTLLGLVGAEEGLEAVRESLAHAGKCAEEAIRRFHPERPEEAGASLLEGLDSLREARRKLLTAEEHPDVRAAIEGSLSLKEREFELAAARCFGVSLECLVEPGRVVPGQAVRAAVRLWVRSGTAAHPGEVRVEAPDGWTLSEGEAPAEGDAGGDGPVREVAFDAVAPVGAPFSSPYWLREPRDPYRYRWPEGHQLGWAFDPPLLSATCEVEVGGHTIRLAAPGIRRETFVGGYRELPLAVLPPIALQPLERRIILPVAAEARVVDLHVSVRSPRDEGAKGRLSLEAPSGWDVDPADIELVFPRGGESRNVRFDLSMPGGLEAGTRTLHYRVATEVLRHGAVLEPVWKPAPGVPQPADETNCVAQAFVVSPADVSIHVVDVTFAPGLRYGYVTGAEEEIVPSLARFGLDIVVLGHGELEFADLESFDAVVVGPNAYLVRDDVRKSAARLLRYVEEGGTMIVQYQGYAYQGEGLAPYPFRFRQPHDRVTWPGAPVTVLQPDHPLMTQPNRIRGADFEGWVHDRGLYFFGEWDRRYVPVLEAHDPDEEPHAGGFLAAAYGRGAYIYMAYSLFRQLAAGVPGAVRLFANLLGRPHVRIRERAERARAIQLFSFLSEAELYEVVRLMSERWFEDGAYLARQGERGGELFLILDGEIEILKEEGGRRERYVARAGDAVGELAILTDLPRAASLRAAGEVKVLTIRGDRFMELVKAHPDVSEGLLRLLATRLATRE
jgi:LmbE family N-acetylglucosaminyl deacetylase